MMTKAKLKWTKRERRRDFDAARNSLSAYLPGRESQSAYSAVISGTVEKDQLNWPTGGRLPLERHAASEFYRTNVSCRPCKCDTRLIQH